jgi:hypothetical protein
MPGVPAYPASLHRLDLHHTLTMLTGRLLSFYGNVGSGGGVGQEWSQLFHGSVLQ